MQFLYDHLVAFALALFAAIACALAALLLKRRITRLAIELRHRIRLVSLAVFLSFAALATIFAQKPATNDVDGVSNPLALSPPRLALPGASDSVLTNGLHITGLSLLTNGVEIASAWPDGVSMLSLNLLYSRYLLSNDWVCIDSWAPLASATSDVRTVAFGGAFTNAPSGFFKLTGLDADGDDDGDGIPNGDERRLGTNPNSADTDGDGISDGEEYGKTAILTGDDFLWLEFDHSLNYLRFPTSSAYVQDYYPTYLGSLAGNAWATVYVALNGSVSLFRFGEYPVGSSTSAAGAVITAFHADAYGDPARWGSMLCDYIVETNESCYFVAEYWNVGLSSCAGGQSPLISAQVIIPSFQPDVVYVSYARVDAGFMDADSVAGLWLDDGPALRPSLPLGFVRAGTTVRYEIGAGTDPANPDTDGDGVPDGIDPFPLENEGVLSVGQDAAWVRANFTNAEEILSVGYANWVDAQVGAGLENGLYKLTATVSSAPSHPSLLRVGDLQVAITNAGDYVFLLEKGFGYEMARLSDGLEVSFAAVDDVGRPMMMANGIVPDLASWAADGGALELLPPTRLSAGRVRWMPTLCGAPDVAHLGPGQSELVFWANLCDYRYAEEVAFHWTADDGNLLFGTPNAATTTVGIVAMPSWRSAVISVSAQVGDYTLVSMLRGFSYGVSDEPQVRLSLSAPPAVLLNRNLASADKLLPATIVFSCDIPTNGTIRILERASAGAVRMWSDAQKTQRVNNGQTWTVTSSNEFVQTVYLEGYETSQTLEDVELQVAYVPLEGPEKSATGHLTVIETGDVTLPGAPDDGLVILKGTSVAFKVGCMPEAAGGLLSTVFQTRRLKGDGTYGAWNFAVGNYSGNAAIFTPSEGGIYQVRAQVGLLDGGADERYYVWEESEDIGIGEVQRGEYKHYGVVSESWQIDLRNCAKRYIGLKTYINMVELPAQYGFPAYPAGEFAYKCNIFVAHRIIESGLTVQKIRGWLNDYPPIANDWANPDQSIRDWGITTADPEPGLVAADYAPELTGHCGIIDFDGRGISAGTRNVNRKFKTWLSGSAFRRYIGGQRDE